MQLGLAEEPRAGYLLNTPIASCSFRYQRWKLDQGLTPTPIGIMGVSLSLSPINPKVSLKKRARSGGGYRRREHIRYQTMSRGLCRAYTEEEYGHTDKGLHLDLVIPAFW